MLSLKTCHDILNKDRKKYSEAEIKIIREELTKFSRVEYEFYKQTKRDKGEEESFHLHESVDGRTSDTRVQLKISRGAT